MDRTKLYAHRGFHDKPLIPENSMAAFRRAIEHGYGVEYDVHLIKDGSLVVFHDSDLKRCTGVDRIIEDCTLEELREYRLEGTDEKIPTLQEVLSLFKTSPGPDGKILPMIIELKVYGGNHEALVKATCNQLETYPGPYVMESFDPFAVSALRRFHPEVERGQLVDNFIRFKTKIALPAKLLMQSLVTNVLTQPDFVAFRFTARDSLGISRAIRCGRYDLVTWTIKTPSMYKDALKEGYTIIFEGFNPKDVEI